VADLAGCVGTCGCKPDQSYARLLVQIAGRVSKGKRRMVEQVVVVVIGAGQAGLAISYYLTQQARTHVVLEKDRQVGSAWASAAGRCGRSCCARAELAGSAVPAKVGPPGSDDPSLKVWVTDAPRKGRCVESALAQFAKRIVTIAS
jgi:hypothetical protein